MSAQDPLRLTQDPLRSTNGSLRLVQGHLTPQAGGGPSQVKPEPTETNARSSQQSVLGPKEDPLRLTDDHRAWSAQIDVGPMIPTTDALGQLIMTLNMIMYDEILIS